MNRKKIFQVSHHTIWTTVGDITELSVDIIVNAANSTLLGGGGVDGAIHKKGGNQIIKACRELRNSQYPEGLPTGKAVITPGGNLQAEYVIHTVGPIWNGDRISCKKLLAEAYRNSLALAIENQALSIAFPAISTGIYNYPKEYAAIDSLEALKSYITHVPADSLPITILLVFYTRLDEDIFLTAISEGNALCH